MTDFPLTRALGLSLQTHGMGKHQFVYAEEIEALLARGVRVKSFGSRETWWAGDKHSEHCTHQALLIGIEPIKRESAEDVLRAILVASHTSDLGGFHLPPEFRERARRVINER